MTPLRKIQWSRGFTLIELMVVISIIAVLSSIILAAVSTARQRAMYASVQESLIQMRNAYEVQYTNSGSYAGLIPINAGPWNITTAPNDYSCSITGGFNYYCNVKTTLGCDDLYTAGSQEDNICKNIISTVNSSSLAEFNFGVIESPLTNSDYAFAVYNPSNTSQLFCIRSTGNALVTTILSTCLTKSNW